MSETLVTKYGMSVTDASEMLCYCGRDKGKKMRELSDKSLYWLATRVTTMRQTEQFRNCVKAARVLREYRGVTRTKTKNVKQQGKMMDSSGQCLAKCNACGEEQSVPTRIFDRAHRPTCNACGGTLQRAHSDAGVDWISMTEAAALSKLDRQTIRKRAKDGVIKAEKRGKYWVISRDSLQRHVDFNKERKK